MIKIVICDDSKDFCDILKVKIEKALNDTFAVDYSIVCLNDLGDFKEYFDNNKVDIVFLDIMVNDINSMDWSLENIPKNQAQLVFLTSYPQSVYNISESECCYFIMKPKMTDDVLEKALRRALQNTVNKKSYLINVKCGRKNSIIDVKDIIYIETLKNRLLIHTTSGDTVELFTALKSFSENLPLNFLRFHKSYMVNMNYIAKYEQFKFVLRTRDRKELPIPPKKYKSAINSYNKYIENI